MMRSRLLLSFFLLLAILVSPLGIVRAQSGRTRPRVPAPQPSAPPPPPVKVPETAALLTKQQAGSTSRFVLKNGIVLIFNEQYAFPLAVISTRVASGYSSEPAGA